MGKTAPESPSSSEQLDLMRMLSEQPAASQREISARLGLSLGKANYLVRALLEKGLVKVQNFRRSDNKMAYAYLLTPFGVAEKVRLTSAFLARKELEFELLKSEIASLQVEVETGSKAQRHHMRTAFRSARDQSTTDRPISLSEDTTHSLSKKYEA